MRSIRSSLRLAPLALLIPLAAARADDVLPPVPAQFLVQDGATASASIAVGADGTAHMAAVSYDDNVVYATCAAGCGEDGAWMRTALPVPGAIRVEIAVAARGAPRLLVVAEAADGLGGRDFLYGACDPGGFLAARRDCSRPGDWTLTRVAGSHESGMGDFFERLLPTHSFALDPAGNPRFVYPDSDYFSEPDHYGVFYMSCEGGCTDPAGWSETDLANHLEYRTEQFTRPALAVGPDGAAHMLAWVYGFEPDGTAIPNDLYYYGCQAGCADRANWRRVDLVNPGSGSYPSPTWDIAVDPQGRPRAAVFVAGAPEQADLADSLLYFWCDADCTTDRGWAGTVVLTDGFGEGPALALDRAGRPRIALLSPDALPVVAACDAGCVGDSPAWTSRFLEAEADIAADRPTALPFTCDGELWHGLMPDLAVAPDGRALVGYDVSVQARCLYQAFQEPEITYDFHEIWRGARVAELADE
ncbi:MAG: hypothetical protein R3F55_24375 [Alphaproteobacteria bacterium]